MAAVLTYHILTYHDVYLNINVPVLFKCPFLSHFMILGLRKKRCILVHPPSNNRKQEVNLIYVQPQLYVLTLKNLVNYCPRSLDTLVVSLSQIVAPCF